MPEINKLQEFLDARNRATTELQSLYDGVSDVENLSAEDAEKADKLMADIKKFNSMYKNGMGLRELDEKQAEAEAKIEDKLKEEPTEYQKEFYNFLTKPMNTMDFQKAVNTLQVSDDEKGGFITPHEQFITRIIQDLDDMGSLRPMATVFSVAQAESLGAPKLMDDTNDFEWGTEVSTAAEDNNITFGKRNLHPHPITGMIKVTNDMLRKGLLPVEAIIRSRISYKLGNKQDSAFMLGTGVDQPLGIYVASAEGIPTSRDKTTAASGTIAYEDYVDTFRGVKSQYRNRGTWVVHEDFVTQAMKLKDGDGRPLWQLSMRVGEPDTIFNRPIMESDYAPNTYTGGNYAAVFGDFSHYWIADGLNYGIQRLNELYAPKNVTAFLTRAYVDGMPVKEEAFSRMKVKA